MKIIDSFKEDAYNSQLDLILDMSKKYSLMVEFDYNENNEYQFKLSKLMDIGLVSTNIVDARCGGVFLKDDTIITVTKESNGNINYYLEALSECDINSFSVSLNNGLIPVVHNGTNWEVADTTTQWYDYDNAKWANAISVTSSSRDLYITGKVVEEIDVLAYYVYIPRYKYQIFNISTSSQSVNEKLVNIEFESVINEKSNGTTVGSWLTHPAFTFADEELAGIWVGKFEMTSTLDNITILPNVTSLRNASISQFFYAINSMNDTDNIYGLKDNIDVHMIKNTEWGAIVYLSNSIYGNTSIVSMNNSSSYLTGGGDYESNLSQSTTGNITGIYDMAGGSYDYVMGVYAKLFSSSGFSSDFFLDSLNNDYYDNYQTGISSMVLGDATIETNSWYGSSSNFISSVNPWFYRGGLYNSDSASLYSYSYSNGFGNINYSTRVVISY